MPTPRPEDGPPAERSRPHDGGGRPRRPGQAQPATEPLDGKLARRPLDGGVAERRRAVVVAGHLGDRVSADSGMTDPSPAVREAALGALDRLGVLDDGAVAHALEDAEPSVRRRAAELAATRPRVALDRALVDPAPMVVEMAAWALGERTDPIAVPSLVALADRLAGHRDPLCRESAVAALGAIGDPSGLSAVVAALGDKPAVRRRAAAALAAFDDPRAETALRSCLADRDWQVRQIAEDLLAVGSGGETGSPGEGGGGSVG